MNYFEKHIGDYIRDTVSLTMLEDGAYNRLIDQVYQSEKPLPLDRKLIYRLARAISLAERKAVDFVVGTFFRETEDGFVQKRIQSEIERYQEKQRKAKASAEARWSKPRVDAFASQTHDASDMRTHSEGNAHQAPVTSNQTPDLKPKAEPERVDSTANTGPSAVGALCIAMRSAGIEVQPADPRMIALAVQGVSADTVSAACGEAKRAKPGERIKPGYVVAILDRWAKEAAVLQVTGAAQPRASPSYQTPNEKAKDLADRLTGKKRNDPTHEFIDINDPPA